MPTITASAADTARCLLEDGIVASRENDSGRALALFAQASDAAPGWALPHFLAGSEHAAAGQWDQAESELANAVLLDAQLEIARYQLGLLQFSSGRAALALVTWQPLVGSSQSPWLGDFVQGFAALAQDAFADARIAFETGLSREGVNPAVAGDVRKVVAGITDLKDAEPKAAVDRTHETTSHVLVANYDKFKLH